MREEGHNPIANLATALTKWVDNSINHKKLALALTAAKNTYSGTRTGGKKRLPELKNWPIFSAENAKDAFFSLLSSKENQNDGWEPDGHATLGLTSWIGCASLNVLIVEQVVLSFKENAKEVLESDAINAGDISRKEYLRAYADLEKSILSPQNNSQEIYNAMASIWKQRGIMLTPRNASFLNRSVSANSAHDPESPRAPSLTSSQVD